MSDNASNSDAPKKILYLGDDKSYWSNLQKRFSGRYYPDLKFQFNSMFSDDQIEIQKMYVEILKSKSNIIYIDFSSSFQTQLFLAQLLTREISLKHVPIVGLIGHKKEVLSCYSAGVDFIHIKSIEYFDVIYDPFLMAYPSEAKEGVFAKAVFKRDCYLYSDMRCGFVTPNYIHVESHVKLELNDVVTVESKIDPKILPSKKYLVKEIYDSHIYYDYSHAFDLEYMYVDEPSVSEEENEDLLGEMDDKTKMKLIKKARIKRREKMAQYEEELKRSKQKVSDWVVDNISDDSTKKIKLLIIEKTMNALSHTSVNLDNIDFTIKFATKLEDEYEGISNFRPNIIVYQFPTKREILEEYAELDEENSWVFEDEIEFTEEQREKYDDLVKDSLYDSYEFLEELIKSIKQLDSYDPFIILYNCLKYSSKSFQEKYSYPFVITNKASLSIKTIIEMAKIFENKMQVQETEKLNNQLLALRKKDPKKYGRLTTFDLNEKKYFINKTNPLSFVATKFPITLTSMNESEITFSAKDEYPMWKTFRIDFPIGLSITTVPFNNEGNVSTDDDGKYIHKALIHSAGEADKKHIRQFVNLIFFSALIEERDKEAEEFKELNERAMKERAKASKELQEAVNSVQDISVGNESQAQKVLEEVDNNEADLESEEPPSTDDSNSNSNSNNDES